MYQPYGQQQAYAPPPPRQSYKTFAITYMAIRGIVLLLLIGIILLASSVLAGSGGGAVVAIFGVIVLVWGAYVVAAGVLGLKGYIAGPIMGLVDGGGTMLIYIAQLFMSLGAPDAGTQVGGSMCGMLMSGAIITVAILALKQRSAGPPPQYGAPPGYGQPQPYGYAAPPQQPANPQFAPQGGYRAPASRRPLPGPASAPTVAAPSPKQAALGVLVLAASVDPDVAPDALPRARAVAAKLLGPAAQARIERQLAQPIEVMDVDADLAQHTAILNNEGNQQLKGNVVKAAQYVLKGPNGIEPLGEQFIATLRQQLGV